MLLVAAGGQLHGDHRQATISQGSQDVGVARCDHHGLDGHVQRNVENGLQAGKEIIKLNK